MLLLCLVLNIGYFLLPISDLLGHSLFPLLIVFTAYHMYALGSDKKWLHNKIIDFLIFISFKCNVLSAKSLEMYCLFMSNFLVHFLIRYSL